ncbi:MAG TPA: ABC transporter permease, partial [Candidatus Limnocylindrales bacterium]|nr:ABC transporter permease [Candidatus Limnocylindrales bacterium]
MVSAPQTSLQIYSETNRDGALELKVIGRLDSTSTGRVWRQAMEAIGRAKAGKVIVDASGIEYCDGSGIAWLVHLRQHQAARSAQLEIRGLQAEFQELLSDAVTGDSLSPTAPVKERRNFAEQIGKAVYEIFQDIGAVISFVGELFVAMVYAARQPRRVRWRDTLKIAEALGVDALPIVLLIGFLMGLIMAFQAAVPLGQFGAQIFVANLIGLAILRELGPLMTAIV